MDSRALTSDQFQSLDESTKDTVVRLGLAVLNHIAPILPSSSTCNETTLCNTIMQEYVSKWQARIDQEQTETKTAQLQNARCEERLQLVKLATEKELGSKVAALTERLDVLHSTYREQIQSLKEQVSSKEIELRQVMERYREDSIMIKSNAFKGEQGEATVEECLRNLYPAAVIQNQGNSRIDKLDIEMQLDNSMIGFEVKLKQVVTATDIRDFERFSNEHKRRNGNLVAGYVFVSLASPNIPKKGLYSLEIDSDDVIRCYIVSTPDMLDIKLKPTIDVLLHLHGAASRSKCTSEQVKSRMLYANKVLNEWLQDVNNERLKIDSISKTAGLMRDALDVRQKKIQDWLHDWFSNEFCSNETKTCEICGKTFKKRHQCKT
jgi:hypothetical protein